MHSRFLFLVERWLSPKFVEGRPKLDIGSAAVCGGPTYSEFPVSLALRDALVVPLSIASGLSKGGVGCPSLSYRRLRLLCGFEPSVDRLSLHASRPLEQLPVICIGRGTSQHKDELRARVAMDFKPKRKRGK